MSVLSEITENVYLEPFILSVFPGNRELSYLPGDCVQRTWLPEHPSLSASVVQGHVLFWGQRKRGEKKKKNSDREREKKRETRDYDAVAQLEN